MTPTPGAPAPCPPLGDCLQSPVVSTLQRNVRETSPPGGHFQRNACNILLRYAPRRLGCWFERPPEVGHGAGGLIAAIGDSVVVGAVA